MKAWTLGLAIVAMGMAGVATAKPRRPQLRFASPAKAIAAEIAFARLAQSKGQWTAFRQTAADDAVMFVPQAVNARDWLKRQKNPPASVAWQPHQTWLSCDGTLAVNMGPWQRADGSQGYFTTVWQRQENGEYKWVMDQGDTLETPLVAPEMIASSVAGCDRRQARPPAPAASAVPASAVPAPAFPAGTRGGWSEDRTLSWAVTVAADCSRALTVSLYRGAGKPLEPVLEKRVAAPQPAAVCPPA
ncbi:hypothetical protein HNO88_003409 [Novosphingobium chloroacetimidivorans]|uniref:DUF4440 domain-containing protein n=1 Tax=Novosphingobium chloroacetimidivorans TaxID=1428314 RepID=A0A7W7KCT1_9SPHN|nr:hypothetical protein [Novosphingobium chloroacetimidivorans]MBB4860071.1 hypothetical protein [Novosphingobium chloroacetimidivorans]